MAGDTAIPTISVTHAPLAITTAPMSVRSRPRSSRIRAAIGTPCAASAAASASPNATSLPSGPCQPPSARSHDDATAASSAIEAMTESASARIVPARRAIGAGSIVSPTSSM